MAASERYEFYIDLFFLTDFYLNTLALGLTAFMGRKPVQIRRIFLAAAFGSLFNCALEVYPLSSAALELFLAAVPCGSMMTSIAFFIKKPRELVLTSALLLLSSVILGGGFLFLKQSLGCSDGECLLLLGAFGAGTMLFFWDARREHARGRKRYPVRLCHQGKCLEFLALADSGNRLREPGSGKPVSIVFENDLEGLADAVPGILYIPFRSVGTDRGMLTGRVFERMEIVTEEGVRIVEKPIVAAAKEPLTTNGDFSMLLPETLIFDSAF